MMIEDFIVISKSILDSKGILQILNHSRDLGEEARIFINRLIQTSNTFLRRDELFKIMSWTPIEDLSFNSQNDERTIKKYVDLSYVHTSAFFGEIAAFSLDNHIVLKRYKHGGTPIYYFDESIKGFDYMTIISDKDNFKSIAAIPFKTGIFLEYEKFSKRLSSIILEMVENKQIKNSFENPKILPKPHREVMTNFSDPKSINMELAKRFNLDNLDIRDRYDVKAILKTPNKWRYYQRFSGD